MSTNLNQHFFNQFFVSGLAGCFAVSIQTVSLIWANNLLKKQKRNNLNFLECGMKIIQKQGLKSLFKGSYSTFLYTSFARFGDVANNFLILNFFKRNNFLQKTPLFIQSWFSWALSTVWRVSLIPIELISNPLNINSITGENKNIKFWRTYSKQIKPEILSLYSWFLVQNYLIEYTQTINYKDSPWEAFTRYASIGFLSMASYDCYLKLKNLLRPISIPSRFWINKTIFKGLNGVVFCTTSQFIKEKLQQ